MINIVRKGIWPIPQEARKCPVCELEAQEFELERLKPTYNMCQCLDSVQYYPTMQCKNCGTVWQYLGEKEETQEKEDE